MLNKEHVQKVLTICSHDGHTIFKAETFNDLPVEFTAKCTKEYESHGNGKDAIFGNNGERLEKLKGIYSLDILYKTASDIGADTSEAEEKMGRGSQATALTNAIYKKMLTM